MSVERSSRMQYAMIIEKGDKSYSAYRPDLLGCIATSPQRHCSAKSTITEKSYEFLDYLDL